MAIRPGRSATLDAKTTDPRMEELKSEARASLDLHLDNKKRELVQELQTQLKKFENGDYTDRLRDELDQLQQQAVDEIAEVHEAQTELQRMMIELNAMATQLGTDGEAMTQLISEMEASSTALQTKVDSVRSRVLNLSKMAGQTLSGAFKRLIGLP